ncbi:MAG: T9SS type A sorting domain-containing protein [Bacteroidia bacterium]|nr:T9SS type A sorting domain-containing protein [Bacteroidia bacterium]
MNALDRMSEVSLNAFLDKEITGLVIKRKNLLLKNSPLPISSQSRLTNYALPQPHLQDVIAAQTGSNLVEQDFNELASLESDYQETQNEIIRYVLSEDTTGMLIDTVIYLLEADTNLYTRLRLITLYIGQEKLTEATTLINQAEAQKDYLWSEEERINITNQLALESLTIEMLQPEADFEIPKWRSTIILLNENGDSLWSRQFNLPQYDNEEYSLSLYDIETTLDNGFVIAGYAYFEYQEPGQIPALIKTDSLGDDGPFIREYKYAETIVEVYPNPTAGRFTIYITSENDKRVIYNYTIYNLVGQELSGGSFSREELKQVDISRLQTGIYLLTIEKNQCCANPGNPLIKQIPVQTVAPGSDNYLIIVTVPVIVSEPSPKFRIYKYAPNGNGLPL